MSDDEADKPREWHVYVLLCADGTLYCGSTTDLARRLNQHNSGKGARYTGSSLRRPVRIAWHKGGMNISEAYSLERRIKKLPRSEKIKMLDEQTAAECEAKKPGAFDPAPKAAPPRPFKTYGIDEIQKVYARHARRCGTVLYSEDGGFTWHSAGMDTGKWNIHEWLFAFVELRPAE